MKTYVAAPVNGAVASIRLESIWRYSRYRNSRADSNMELSSVLGPELSNHSRCFPVGQDRGERQLCPQPKHVRTMKRMAACGASAAKILRSTKLTAGRTAP